MLTGFTGFTGLSTGSTGWLTALTGLNGTPINDSIDYPIGNCIGPEAELKWLSFYNRTGVGPDLQTSKDSVRHSAKRRFKDMFQTQWDP